MGSIFSSSTNDDGDNGGIIGISRSLIGSTCSGRKRKWSEADDEVASTSQDRDNELLNTPKRKRIKSTAKYIYQTLFLDGEGSDITIAALNREWHLHKLYMKQCGYFAGMFSGSWVESDQSRIEISIPDNNVTEEALTIAFGSLYKDDIFIKPVQVVSVLGAATLLQLDGLIQQCTVMMKATIRPATVCHYHSAAFMYGLLEVEHCCFYWLEKNLMLNKEATMLKEISVDLMKNVVASPDLVVIQVEMDIYSMLRRWLYLKLNPTWEGVCLLKDTDTFFKETTKDVCSSFLATEEGLPYLPAFQAVHWQHVADDVSSLELIKADQIVPFSWLLTTFHDKWQQMLRVDQGEDTGNQLVNNDQFFQHCARYGRILRTEGSYYWRWTGFNFGLDLLITYSNHLILLKRNCTATGPRCLTSHQAQRTIHYRMTVISLDASGRTVYMKSTGVKCLTLNVDEEVLILTCDGEFTFPLLMSFNVLCITPPAAANTLTPELKYPLNLHSSIQTETLGRQDISDSLKETASQHKVQISTESQTDDICVNEDSSACSSTAMIDSIFHILMDKNINSKESLNSHSIVDSEDVCESEVPHELNCGDCCE